jgi:hypothetical protein
MTVALLLGGWFGPLVVVVFVGLGLLGLRLLESRETRRILPPARRGERRGERPHPRPSAPAFSRWSELGVLQDRLRWTCEIETRAKERITR